MSKCESCEDLGYVTGETDWFFGWTYDKECPNLKCEARAKWLKEQENTR